MATERRGRRGALILQRAALYGVAPAALALVAFGPPRPQGGGGAAAESLERGRAVYVKWCAGCHGEEGRGDGPAAGYVLPKPRDFTLGIYQIRTTETGALPTDEDLRRIVDEGMPGTSMPGWRTLLSAGDRAAVVAYLRSLSPAFSAPAPEPLAFGRDPGGGRAAVDSGRALYRQIECWKCHGDAGRGDGQSAPRLEDDADYPIRAADLTRAWLFNGGARVEDIYRRLRTGLDGTPMPSFSDLVDADLINDGDLWRLAHYVRSLSPDRTPRQADIVRAGRVEGALPEGPDDSAWVAVERFYVPLVGQVIVRSRWFAPTVTGVWVQALHNGAELALRVAWSDPSASPDSTWEVWRRRVAAAMRHDDSAAAADTTPLPDRLAVQFPPAVPTGMDRPPFLLGRAEAPVYLWRWESAPRHAVEALARGPDVIEPLAPSSDSLRSAAIFDRGEWRVQLSRAVVTADTTGRLQFVAGRPIPMAVFAWDGSNGETGTRMAISSWIAIHLAEPARAGTVVWPLLAMVTTGGLGLFVVARAQRAARAQGGGATESGSTTEEG